MSLYLTTLQGEFYDTPPGFGIVTFHTRGTIFFVLHNEPLEDTNASRDAIVVNKCKLLFFVC
jgi:hypothetical protein